VGESTTGSLARVQRWVKTAMAFVLRLYAIQLVAAFLVFLGLAGLTLWGLSQPSPPPPTLH
jgi:hypothetical protein